MKTLKLNNNIQTILKRNHNTPRTALCLYVRINKPESKAGVYTLLNRLFLQGTKSRSSEVLANELDKNGIDLYSEMKYDFIRFKVFALNEDFEKACELLSDIIQNSTMDQFEKEIFKLKGEIAAELDNPKTKLMEEYYKKLYENHYYGNTYLRIMEDIDKITIDDIIDAYNDIFKNSQKCFVICGDIDENNAQNIMNKYFSELISSDNFNADFSVPEITSPKLSKITKEDANQAQIIQGWLVPSFLSEDHVPLMLFSTILGSMGLSSRLFRELREKKGLAYTVRSSYETNKFAGSFSVYIATEPTNIQESVNGFKEEINKLKNEIISEDELNNAKNNLLGKRQFFSENNLQKAALIGYYVSSGYAANYSDIIEKKIQEVTALKIQEIARKYFGNNYVTTIVAPSKSMEGILF